MASTQLQTKSKSNQGLQKVALVTQEFIGNLKNEEQDFSNLVRQASRLTFQQAVEDGTTIAALRAAFATKPEDLEMIIYCLLDSCRVAMGLTNSSEQENSLMDAAISIGNEAQHGHLTLEELVFG